ncbi:Ankyrin repeat-containing domain protein [Rhypophila decipiens]
MHLQYDPIHAFRPYTTLGCYGDEETFEGDSRATSSLSAHWPALASSCGRSVSDLYTSMDVLRVTDGNLNISSAPTALLWGAFHNMTTTMEKCLLAAGCLKLNLNEMNIDLLGRHPEFNSTSFHGVPFCAPGRASAIHFAARNESNDAAKYLLSLGAKLTLPAGRLCSCLATALPTQFEIRNRQRRHSHYAGWWLHFALCQGHSTMAEILLEAGAPATRVHQAHPSIQAFHSAALADHDPWIYQLLQDKTDGENRQNGVRAHIPTQNNLPILESLNIDLRDWRFPSALHVPLCLGDWETALLLLDLGAGVGSSRQSSDIFPAIFAPPHAEFLESWPGEHDGGAYLAPAPALHEEVLARIVKQGRIELDRCWSRPGETPLTIAGKTAQRSKSHLYIVPLLLRLGASLNCPDRKGNTLLHKLVTAVPENWELWGGLFEPLHDMIKKVLATGGVASLKIKNMNGKTPVELLAELSPSANHIRHGRCVMIMTTLLRYAEHMLGPSVRRASKMIERGTEVIHGQIGEPQEAEGANLFDWYNWEE